MSEEMLPVKRTEVPQADYVRSVFRSWSRVGEGIPSEKTIAVLRAQYMIETGGAACWNFNIGNVKHFKGDGFNYHCLGGVWEGYAPAQAQQFIASGRAVADPSPNHAKSVGPGKQSIIFTPPDSQTWFRAFSSLDEGMAEHLSILAKRFSKAWPAVLAGDYAAFAKALFDQHYFTADPAAYAAGMRPSFEALVASSTYEDLIASMNTPPAIESVEVMEGDAVLWDRDGELYNLASVALQGGMGILLEDALAGRDYSGG